MPPIKVYDNKMNLVAFLENAFSIGYEQPLNGLWTATFSLAATDPKNDECLPLRYVEIFDGDTRVDLFRILPTTATRADTGETIVYQCEHVLATLLDDVLFQFHTVGNLGYYTFAVIDYVLSKQTTARWMRAQIDFPRQFEYTWENESLLGALFSIPKPFDEDYMWSWDTKVYPWRLSLVRPSNEVQAYIRYGVNLAGIEKITDPTNICTRIYPLGYGEGDNQLTIKDVNGGLPFLDSDTQGTYGLINRIWVDQRFTNPESLKATAQSMLDDLKIPRVSYTVNGVELFRLTSDPIDRFTTGTQVRIIDQELGIDINARVVKRSRPDVTGEPGAVELEIANKPQDIAGSVAELSNRQRIQEVYAQGATNIDTRDFSDNADPTHPAKLRFYVPEEAVRINKVLLNWTCEPFRAYSKAIAGGGALATSTAAGGGTTTSSGASSVTTTGPSSLSTTDQGNGYDDTRLGSITYDTSSSFGGMDTSGAHNHGIPDGTKLRTETGGTVTWATNSGHEHALKYHSHTFYGTPHIHGMNHTHDMPHTHTVTLPAHAHDINLPNHTHDIQYGIYEGPTPSTLQIKVDGVLLPNVFPSSGEIDLLTYLGKDGAGKITRGTFHTIEIAPISLGRIVASVVTQIFVQSRGGGNY